MTRLVGAYHHDYRRPPAFGFGTAGSSKDPSADEDYWSTPSSQSPKSKPILEDQCWYLGKIKRIDAVNLLKNNGDFLVRDSITNRGDYVLTGLCRGEAMHFEIHRAPSSDPKTDLYYFEDEQFRSVVDLIQFYYNHRRQVTAKSQFILLNPVSNVDKLETPNCNKFQMEIEATYAPFINKQAQLSARYDRSLSQTAMLNQAKKRLNGSEHDLMHLMAMPSSSNHLPSSKSFSQLTTTGGDPPQKQGVKVTSFGVDENDGFCIETTYIPPKNCRPIPKFPPPKSPIAYPEDLDDYDDLDYEAMEEEQNRRASMRAPCPTPSIRCPPVIPPKPLSLIQKRHSEFMAPSEVEPRFPEPTRKHSAHSLFQPSNDTDDTSLVEELLPAYLDRTQSCQNLVYRQRTKSGREVQEVEDSGFRRYPSVKIDPAPLLPTRSKESLCSLSALAVAEKNDEVQDYDDLGSARDEADYDSLKEKDRKPPIQSPPEPAPRPKTLAMLRAISQPPKQMRHLLNYLSSLTTEKLSLLITAEDVKVFNLTQNNNNHSSDGLKKLFLAESRLLREEVLGRNACIQLTVALTIQKAVNPKDVVKIWILTASHLLHKIGNGFAFGAIMAALISERKKKPRVFADLEATAISHLRSIVPVYEDFIAGKMPPTIAGCFLPFIQPLLQLFSASDYVQANKFKSVNGNGLDNLEVLSNLIHLARHVLFDNGAQLNPSIESSVISGPNPFSTESLIHCILATPTLTEPKESERRKIRQLFEQSF